MDTPRADARAARLLHAAQALRRREGLTLSGLARHEDPDIERLLRSRLNTPAWRKARNEGERLTPAQAWTEAG